MTDELKPILPPAELIEDDGFVTVHPPMKGKEPEVRMEEIGDGDWQDIGPESVATYVVFDTENNGLFEYKDPITKVSIPADAPGQPRLASICVIIADQNGEEIERKTTYIRPDGWSMHDNDEKSREKNKPTASEVNGLTDEFLQEHGVPVREVLDEWHSYVDRGLVMVAYNAQHDNKQMRAELRRAGMDDRFEETPNSCLMRSLKPYKEHGLPVAGFGMVKLSKACEFFGIKLDNAHDAEADTEAALEILKVLLRDGNLIEPKVHYAAKPAGSAA